MTKKMDDARRASAERDAMSKPSTEDLNQALDEERPGRHAAYRGLKRKKIDTHCPDCLDSVSHLRWDGRRALWVHPRCGGTWTQDELEYAKKGDQD